MNDKRKEIVDKMERDVKVNTNLGGGLKQPQQQLQSLQAKPYKLPVNTYEQDEDDEFDKEFNLLQKKQQQKQPLPTLPVKSNMNSAAA